MQSITPHSSPSKQTSTRRFCMLALALAAVGVAAAVALAAHRPHDYRPASGDDRPPADRRYRQALKLGLAGDLEGGERQMLALAREERGSSEGAWALYQAGLAA